MFENHILDNRLSFVGIDTDDLLDEGTTDSSGHFELSGSTTEITSIDPKLNIYHDCNDLLVRVIHITDQRLNVPVLAVPTQDFDHDTRRLHIEGSATEEDL